MRKILLAISITLEQRAPFLLGPVETRRAALNLSRSTQEIKSVGVVRMVSRCQIQ